MYKDNDIDVKVEFLGDIPFIHCTVFNMKRRKFQRLWSDILTTLKDEGYPVAFSCIPEGDDKLYRFQMIFGMKEVLRSNGQILLARET